jgi:uncharacterized membrane protein HdeD (DUF308 family)
MCMTPQVVLRPPSWRLPVARSVVALGLAAGVTAWHRPTIAWLALAFSAYCVADAAIFVAAAHRRSITGLPPWALMMRGIAGIGAAAAIATSGRTAPESLHALIVGWAVLAGLFDMVSALFARGRLDGEAFLWLNGLVTAFLGLILSMLPAAAVADTGDLIALYATLAGSLLLLLGARIAVTTAPRPVVALQRSA